MRRFKRFGTRSWHIVAVGVIGGIFAMFIPLLHRAIVPTYTFIVVNVTVVLITVGFVRHIQTSIQEARGDKRR